MTTQQLNGSPGTGHDTDPAGHPPAGTLSTIGLVARREFTTRVYTKAFLISTGVFLAVIIGGIIAFSVFGKDDPTEITVAGDATLVQAVESSAEALDVPVEITTAETADQARDTVTDGAAEVAVTSEGSSYVVTSEDELDGQLRAVLDAAVQQLALDRALAAQDVDRDQFAKDLASTAVDYRTTEPTDPDEFERMTLAYIAVLLLFFTVYLYGLYVAMGVVEEKSSRVVELLLATIKPIHLLAGKVLGIGAIGLMLVVGLGGVALVTGLATDVISVDVTAVRLLGAVVLWYVLGYGFFAVLYAALGALVSRQEDVNSATGPLTLLSFATFFAAQGALSDPDATWVRVLAWIPPFSSMLQPVRIAAGVTSPVEVIGAVVLMLASLVAAALAATAIYRRSVLNIGARQSLKQVLGRDG